MKIHIYLCNLCNMEYVCISRHSSIDANQSMYCVHLSLSDCQHLSSELNLPCDHSGARNTNRQLQDM